MILKASQRAGARQLSNHLMNDQDNDHITLYEVRGFMADDLHGALSEAYAISKGTKCKQFMFSVSLNPPQDVLASENDFLRAANAIEEKVGLAGQPRAIVFHEKEGRRHAHVVWSRINPETMTAINLPHFKRKLNDLSRDLYLEHGWSLPDGLRRDGGKSPLNFTLAEWQQAKRSKLDPREIKQSFMGAWQRSDNLKAFKHALEEKGYFIAKGDRRGFVAIDVYGEVYSIPKWTGVKTKEVKSKLGDPEQLPSLDEVKTNLSHKLTDKLKGFIEDVDAKHTQDSKPLEDKRAAMVKQHRAERKRMKEIQAQKWKEENKTRAARLNKGLRGLWDKITGQAGKIKERNTHEAYQTLQRYQKQRDGLITVQMNERRELQQDIYHMRRKHTQNRQILAREINQSMKMSENKQGFAQVRERRQMREREIPMLR